MSHDVTPEYAKSLGRIGGQLLAENLLFQGQDVQFDTDLMYLDVVNKRIGINNYGTSPADLYLGGDKFFQSVNLIVDGITSTDFGWVISTNNIQRPSTGTIYITPVQVNPTITATGVGVADVNITAPGLISTKVANKNILLSTNGTGISVINGDLTLNGTDKLWYVTGNILVDGNYIAGSEINFGDQSTDTINFSAEQAASLVPKITSTYDIGSSSMKWNFVYSQQLEGTSTVNTIGTLGGITLRGNSLYSADIARDIIITAPDYDSNGGKILFNGLVPFTGGNINNNTVNVYNAPYYLLSTNDGYVQFSGSNGVVFPLGTTSQRNTEILGTTRYNSDLLILEIFNGTNWQPANGNIALATEEYMSEESLIYDLMLG